MTVLRDSITITTNLVSSDGTYAVSPGVNPPATGYVVALAGRGEQVDRDRDRDRDRDISHLVLTTWAWVRREIERAAYEHCFLGSWTDGSVLYLDVVKVFQDKALALELAERTGELAIYDLAAGAEIRTSWGRGER